MQGDPADIQGDPADIQGDPAEMQGDAYSCPVIHHVKAWAHMYGMPLVLLFKNYRYLQIFEDISNSFTDICN